jgi:hypothetical protein
VDVGRAAKDDLHGFANTEVDQGQPEVLSVEMARHLNDAANDDPRGEPHGDRRIHVK